MRIKADVVKWTVDSYVFNLSVVLGLMSYHDLPEYDICMLYSASSDFRFMVAETLNVMNHCAMLLGTLSAQDVTIGLV